MENHKVYDVIVAGGGPVGLWAAYYSAFRGLKTVVIESTKSLGGQAMYLYPEKVITDLPGIPAITGSELVKNLITQISSVNVEPVTDANVISISKSGEMRTVVTTKGDFTGKYIILTPGVGNFLPNKLGINEVDSYEGRGLYYFVKSREDFRGREIAIVGGGDSAVDWALELAPVAKKVYLIHRRTEFRAAQSNIKKAGDLGVTFIVPYVVKSAEGEKWIEGVKLANAADNSELELQVQAILMMLGYKLDISPAKNWGVEYDQSGILIDSKSMTSDPHIYAAGDISTPRNGTKQKLLIIGFAQATTAVNSISKQMNPYEPAYVHSTNVNRLGT